MKRRGILFYAFESTVPTYLYHMQEDPEFQPVPWCGQVTCGQKFSKQWDC